jgi:ATP-binding cassette subfamily B (MDR/TAP) protein 1
LTQRIRAKAFAHFLRQEVAYFDRSENSSGAISARLSSDAFAIQQMTGTRLGIIFETLAVLCFGLILGLFYSWQLTLIVLFSAIITFSITYMNIRLQARLKKRSTLILERANSVRSDDCSLSLKCQKPFRRCQTPRSFCT